MFAIRYQLTLMPDDAPMFARLRLAWVMRVRSITEMRPMLSRDGLQLAACGTTECTTEWGHRPSVGTNMRGYQDCDQILYDDAGNRLSERCYGKTIDYAYSSGDNILDDISWTTGSTCGSPELATRSMAPDSKGRLTRGYTRKFPEATDDYDLVYDAENHVIMTVVGADTYNYYYDERNLRRLKETPAGEVRFDYDTAGRLLTEDDGLLRKEYVWLNGELVAMLYDDTRGSDSTSYAMLTDQLGTPMRLVDMSDGSVDWAADYEAFGRAWEYVPGSMSAPIVSTSVRFPGQYEDKESGLYYNWWRYYDPNSGRYITSEPLATMIPGWNQPTYAYALNNPVGFGDLNGLYVTWGGWQRIRNADNVTINADGSWDATSGGEGYRSAGNSDTVFYHANGPGGMAATPDTLGSGQSVMPWSDPGNFRDVIHPDWPNSPAPPIPWDPNANPWDPNWPQGPEGPAGSQGDDPCK